MKLEGWRTVEVVERARREGGRMAGERRMETLPKSHTLKINLTYIKLTAKNMEYH